jgi:uncharacterized glyoxalase superfamily protein PhnB
MQVIPYLNFNGDCAAAFKFYERCLGGKIEAIMTHGESPIAKDVPPSWHGSVLHARLVVGDTVLMASDSPPEHYERPQGLYVSLQIDRRSRTDFPRVVPGRQGDNADRQDLLGGALRHAGRPIRHPVDG